MHSRGTSLPSWECGLKFHRRNDVSPLEGVTPYVGVWIEIWDDIEEVEPDERHSLRGSVD